jgi:Uma2 family endonuclease
MQTQTITPQERDNPPRQQKPIGEGQLRRRLLELLDEVPAPEQMTYEEFLDWADEDTLAEWVHGEAIMTSPASNLHQDIAGFLSAVLRVFTEAHNLGIVRIAPFQMKLENGREPDILFLAKPNLHRLRATYLDGPADLVIEVISPESVGRDRGDKFYEYARGGVPEYWLVDQQTGWVEFYHLKDGHYRLAFTGDAGVYRAATVPDFWLKVEWLWQEPLPNVDDVLLEIGGQSYAQRWIERLQRLGYLTGG